VNKQGVWGLYELQPVNRVIGSGRHPTSLVDVLSNDPSIDALHNLLLLLYLLLPLANVSAIGLGLQHGKQIDASNLKFLLLASVSTQWFHNKCDSDSRQRDTSWHPYSTANTHITGEKSDNQKITEQAKRSIAVNEQMEQGTR